MKRMICAGFGVVSSVLAWAFGGWDTSLLALLVCMGVDFISGSVVALVFHNSKKSETGAYNSVYGLKGLCKKGLMLLFVLVAVQIDALVGADYVRDGVCVGFGINEILSIMENLGLAGVPMPDIVKKALEQLHQ